MDLDKGSEQNFNSNKNIGKFWIIIQNVYPALTKEALKKLIPFQRYTYANQDFLRQL